MRLRRWVFVLCCCALFAGCSGGGGDKPVKVEGTITLDGAPLPDATIVFTPKDGKGQVANGRSGADGKFYLTTRNTRDGAMPGSYKVTIKKQASTGDAGGGMADTKGPEYMDRMKNMNKQKDRRTPTKPGASDVHSNYGDVKTTPLEFTIDAKTSDLEIPLNKTGT